MNLVNAIDLFADKFEGKRDGLMYSWSKEDIRDCTGVFFSKEMFALKSDTLGYVYSILATPEEEDTRDTEESRFLWENVVAEYKPFMEWMKKHNFEEKDSDLVDVSLGSNGLKIVASFDFEE